VLAASLGAESMVGLHPCSRAARLTLFTAILGTSAAVPLWGQSTARISQPIDSTVLVRIPGSTHPLTASAHDEGRVNGDLSLERMVLVLKPSESQQSALAKLIDDQHNRTSVSYHQWLMPEQYGAQFGVDESDLRVVSGWLQAQGFTVGSIARGKQWIEFSGTAGQVERVFHTEMHNYVLNGEKHIANSQDISLPQALTPVVTGVLSLHNFQKPGIRSRRGHAHRDADSGQLVPDYTLTGPNGTVHLLSPGDSARIYNTTPLLSQGIDGSGVSIAIVGRTDIYLSDVQTFRQMFELPVNDPVFIVNGLDPGFPPTGDIFESDLDVQWAGAMAPQAEIKFVTSASTLATDGVDLSISYTIDNLVAPIMSSSYGACEAALGTAGNAHFTALFQQAAAEGITVFVSTGDSGNANCDPSGGPQFQPAQYGSAVSGLATTHYTVSVGGTEFNENGLDGDYWLANNRPDLSSAIGYIPEEVWNESCDPTVDPNQCNGTGGYYLLAGGGGPSNCSTSTVSGGQITCISGTPKPSWQAGIGVPNDGVRDIPDLSLAAAGHDGYLVCDLGDCLTEQVGGQPVILDATVESGTSASAPSMAGIMALLEQKNGTYQGVANYSLYQLAAAENLSHCNSSKIARPHHVSDCVFYDVTVGNNNVPGQPGYQAGVGYDTATGLGTVNAANLVAAWSSAAKLGTTATLAIKTRTVEHGQPVPINLVVAPETGSGAPTGDFSLVSSRNSSIFGGTLSNGSFSGGVNGLPGGTYKVSAHYGGDAMFASSNSADQTITVTREDSAVNMYAWYQVAEGGNDIPIVGPEPYGTPIGLQIQIAGKSGVGSPTGRVRVTLDNATDLGTFALNQQGSAMFEVDNLLAKGLLPGKHVFAVTYLGDESFSASPPAEVTVDITKGVPRFAIQSGLSEVTVGTPVELFIWSLHFVTGTVNLYDNGKKIAGPIPLVTNGIQGQGFAQAEYTGHFAVGSHNIQYSYSGDSIYTALPIQSHGSWFFTVNPPSGATTIVHLEETPSTITLGNSVTYVVSVRPAKASGPIPTGTVTLVIDSEAASNPLGTPAPATLVNGNATLVLPGYVTGRFVMLASYSGDANYGPANSKNVELNITAATPTVTLTTEGNVVPAGGRTGLMVAVIGQPNNPNLSLPFGYVRFFDSFNGAAERPLGPAEYLNYGNGNFTVFSLTVMLPAGQHGIRAQYYGSNSGFFPQDWKAASSNLETVTVQ